MIVSNSSPLIVFSRINRLSLLRDLFGEIHIPRAVYEEVVRGRKGAEIVDNKWIKIKDIKDKDFAEYLSKMIGKGEAEAIVLAKEYKSKLLIDDAQGRKHAELLNLQFMGSLGLLKLAKNRGSINSVKEIIDEMKKQSFRIDEELITMVLKSVGEV
jgi:predicted nucleic acid-binding protein